jgi:very-short-patch-repair endonuclease
MRGIPLGLSESEIAVMRSKAASAGWKGRLKSKRLRKRLKFYKSPKGREMQLSAAKKRGKSKRFRELRSSYMTWRWEDEKYKKRMLKVIKSVVSSRTSKIQMLIFNRLREIGFKAKLNYQVGTYFADIAFPRRKIALEVDGSYWHERRVAADRKRDIFFRSLGWIVKRFVASRSSIPQIVTFLGDTL